MPLWCGDWGGKDRKFEKKEREGKGGGGTMSSGSSGQRVTWPVMSRLMDFRINRMAGGDVVCVVLEKGGEILGQRSGLRT